MSTTADGIAKQSCDMQDDMKAEAITTGTAAIELHTDEKDQAQYIKRAFDEKYGPTWHCIVGSDFKAHVTYEAKTFVFFYVGRAAICLYKTP